MNILSRMKLWQKLAALVVAMAVPTALLGFFYFSKANAEVSQAEAERMGAQYAEAVGAVLTAVINHRGHHFALLTGDNSRSGAVASAAAEVDRLIGQVDAIDAQVGREFRVSSVWQAAKSEWGSLKSAGSQMSAADSATRHDAVIARFYELLDQIAAASGMNVDPDPAVSALVSVATYHVPRALAASGSVRQHAVQAAVKGYLGGDDRMAIDLYRRDALAELSAAASNLQRASDVARSRAQPLLSTAQATFDSYFGVIKSKLLDAQSIEATSAEIYDAGNETTRALSELSRVAYEVMDEAIEDRLSSTVTWRNLSAAIAAISLVMSMSLGWLITRVMTRPMQRAIQVFEAISAGRYDNKIEHAGTDEANQVLQALDQMQNKLRAQIESERAQAAENARIRQALDKVSTSVVLADAQHRIIYLNETAQATFARAQAEIRKSLPGFDASRLKGSSLDALSVDPAQQRRMLDSLTGTEVQERTLGGCTFRTVANPVISDAGERIGTVMEWTDRTQEVAVEKEMQNMLSAVISGDLTQRISLEGKAGFFEAMSRGVNQLADNLAEIVSRVKIAAEEVYRGAQEISQGNANLSQRTEEQSSSLEETASSMEEMTSTVKQNADNAGQANQLAMAARDQAEKGGAVVSKAVRAMTEINEASRKIADIIGVIDEIAFQTNLLALNAAVEAARAGEQGRGFAVVASEVRSLAGRSAKAAKEIKELIQDSVRKVEDGSVLVTQSGQTLEHIVASVKKVSDIVAEIAAASREQSSGIEQVNRAVMQMDELTQQNAALVEQATAASQAMAEQARALNEMMSRYRLKQSAQSVASSAETTASRANGSAQQSEGAPRVERRGPNRPWSGQAVRNRLRAAAAAQAAPVTKLAANGGSSDTEWQEF